MHRLATLREAAAQGIMEFHARQIAPPRYWEEFEDLCLDLFRRVWRDQYAQKNGRRGQPQAGTDISGRR